MATKKTAKAKAKTPTVEEQVHALGEALTRYAPERVAKVRPAKSLAKLEALVAIPPALRALWSWADGFPGLLVTASDDLERGFDLFSVSVAAKTIAMNREAGGFADDLIPFAGEDGSGDCYALDARGRVLYWDHEEGEASKHAASISVVLANTRRSIEEQALFGGPERKPGTVDEKALALEKAIDELKDPASVSMMSNSPANKVREGIGKLKKEADQHRLYLRLRDRLNELDAPPRLTKSLEESILYTAMETKSWGEALASLKATGGVAGGRDNWSVVGLAALDAGELEVALLAFSGGGSLDSRLGEIAVARKLGRTASRPLAGVAAEIAAKVERLRGNLSKKPRDLEIIGVVGALVERATAETLGGEEKAAQATLDEAYRYPIGKQFRDPVEANAIARLAGLVPRG